MDEDKQEAKLFKCNVCRKEFGTVKKVIRHHWFVHRKQQTAAKRKQKECQTCHQKISHGNKSRHQRICGKKDHIMRPQRMKNNKY